MKIRVGVVGSRDYPNEDYVRAIVASFPVRYPNGFVFVSGGAYRRTKEWIDSNPGAPVEGGVDFWAEDQARIAGYDIDIMPANWGLGRAAGMIRNKELVESCDYVHIFWDGKSPGTRNVIHNCKRLKKDFKIYGAS